MKKYQVITNDLAIDAGPGRNPVIALSNEERFTSAFYSEPLTAYGIGWRDPENLQAILDEIAPPLETPRRFEYKSAVNAEEFLSETDDIRAIGGAFKKVEYKGSSVSARTLNKGLTITLDKDEIVAGTEERTVARLINRGFRNDLRRAVALLIANGNNTAKTWDATAGKDPDADILAQLVVALGKRGIPCNVALYGGAAWQKRQLSHRAQNSAGGFASASMLQPALAALLGLDRVVVNKSVYQSSATAKTAVLGAYVILYYASAIPGTDDPSNIKQFWTPTESGRVRVYREEHAKTVDISVERNSLIAIPSSLGIEKLTIS